MSVRYRNTLTGRVVERDEADAVMDRSRRWRRVEHKSSADPEPAAVQSDAPSFDPTKHTVKEVNAYLATASRDERTRVMVEEIGGKSRRGILVGPYINDDADE